MMKFDKQPHDISNKYDLENEDDITKLLENGDPKELEEFRLMRNLTNEQVSMASLFAKQRKWAHERMGGEHEARIKTDPTPTEEELSMGAYAENIEPQVRDTVLNLRRKGYNTYESGYYGPGGMQNISIIGEDFKDLKLSESLTAKAAQKGIKIETNPGSIILIPEKFLKPDELTDMWQNIENEIPPLNKKVEDGPGAASFREKQYSAHSHEETKKQELLSKMQDLRLEVHKKMDEETLERIRNNPKPTEEELYIGAFAEMLEHQVRDIIFKLHRKGYSTESSGFSGNEGEIQSMDGYFVIDKATKEKLEAIGVKVLKGKDLGFPGFGDNYTFIRFSPEEADVGKIIEKWNEIAELLPAQKMPATPSINGGAEEFRRQYSPKRTDIEKLAILKTLQEDLDNNIRKKLEERLEIIDKEKQI